MSAIVGLPSTSERRVPARALRRSADPTEADLCRWGIPLPLIAALSMHPSSARAAEYETFIEIDEEEDLYDLWAMGQIEDQTFRDLQELLRRRIDLDAATREELYALPNLNYDQVDRILAFRAKAGSIRNPSALVTAGVLSARELRSVRAFLTERTTKGRRTPVQGEARYRTVWTQEDRRVPPMALEARVRVLEHLTIGGALTLDRNALGRVTYDPSRDGLITDGVRLRATPGKYFVMWDAPHWGIIAGTYAIGFGQRLTFDTSGRYTPNGFFLDGVVQRPNGLVAACKESAGEREDSPCRAETTRYSTPDYGFREGLRGIAAGIKRLALPVGWLQAYGFASLQTRSVYQYDVFRPDRCRDPSVESPECEPPPVFVRPKGDPGQPASIARQSSLPDMHDEILGGANVSYFADQRSHVGVTGYGATQRWRVRGMALDFRDAAATPRGGPYGAIGLDAAWGRAWADLFFEFTYAFDSDPAGGGGPAAILRHTATWKHHELELVARYYDPGFANPFARATAAPDETRGLRVRDETGGRLRYVGAWWGRWRVRASVDIWTALRKRRPQVAASLQNEVQAATWFLPGVWLELRDRDLSSHGRGQCYDLGSPQVVEIAEPEAPPVPSGVVPIPDSVDAAMERECRGARIQLQGRLRFEPHDWVSVIAQYRHSWVDDPFHVRGHREDLHGALLLEAQPVAAVGVRARLSWAWWDIDRSDRLEHTLWAYVQAEAQVRGWFRPALRYDLRVWLDDRASTERRHPNPEHWVHLQLESRF